MAVAVCETGWDETNYEDRTGVRPGKGQVRNLLLRKEKIVNFLLGQVVESLSYILLGNEKLSSVYESIGLCLCLHSS